MSNSSTIGKNTSAFSARTIFCLGNNMLQSDTESYLPSSVDSLSDLDPSYLTDFSDSSLNSAVDGRLEAPICIHADSIDSINDTPPDTNEHEFMVYKNTHELSNDLRFVLGMPEMCDVTFLVGTNKVEVHGVKAILATRCLTFYRLFITHEKEASAAQSSTCKFKSRFLRFRRRSESASERKSKSRKQDRLRIPVPDFDVATFKRLLLFLHCGSVSVNIESVIGLMNAAEAFCVEDLEKACHDFTSRCLNMRTALQLLHNAEPYVNRGSTNKLIQRVLNFIDTKGEDIIKSREFDTLSKRNARAILLRKSLSAQESTKWDAALRWSRKYYQRGDSRDLRKAMKTFVMNIRLEKLSPEKLMCEVQPLGVVSDCTIHAAVASKRRQVIGRDRDDLTMSRRQTRPMMGVKAASLRVTPRRRSSRSELSIYSIQQRYACDSDSGFTSSESA